ncbi:hypothetical protein BDV93DRAFT_610835 [Ceratobasidium sp. AG-I]|nr:hypothetical protein BDV93DRAFT_610835 [Ceratobasidium sp. AG-I]
MELKEHELWVQKHVRPDETVFILHDVGAAAFGKGQDMSFSWAFGPITMKACVNTEMLSIGASMGVSIPFIGYKELANLSGDLNKGVSTAIDAYAVKGKVKLFLKDGKQVWIRLELSSPFFSAQGKEFKIFTLLSKACVELGIKSGMFVTRLYDSFVRLTAVTRPVYDVHKLRPGIRIHPSV